MRNSEITIEDFIGKFDERLQVQAPELVDDLLHFVDVGEEPLAMETLLSNLREFDVDVTVEELEAARLWTSRMGLDNCYQQSLRHWVIDEGGRRDAAVFSLAFGNPKQLLEILQLNLRLSGPLKSWHALGDAISTAAGLPYHLVLCEWEVFAERFPEDAYRMLLLFVDCHKSNPETCPKPQLYSTSGNELRVEEELERLGSD